MAVKWGARRQILYYIVGAIIFVILLAVAYRLLFFQTPTCFDATQNGNEQGIDCGGSCARICANMAKAPTVLWQRAFKTSPQTYSAAAYIQNNNVSVSGGAREVRYSFQLLDSNNILVAEREGTVNIPPMQTIPVVELGIEVGNREVAHTFFELTDQTIAWQKVASTSIQTIEIVGTPVYKDGKVIATVANNSFEDARRVQVVAVLFDNEEVALAASKATVAKINRRSNTTITFTWPEAVPNVYFARVTVIPSF